ncbi:hypothetical protein IRP63_14925 (plasmid) [Clostridium botulinum]|uniref:Uncharacterized protein n=1 Tax=Clostridium botulinum C/D str. DC5 TaxID=1443128 RepID=A0A0A0HY94_CLOBO|nr:hypothetical protein [Clostridium botulinum]KGM93378.1 hypothetical protein Z955_15540 [Clostridium botulinum C/D str. DC5]KOC56938.1 hypothetical protein ADU89_01730 [Clostridium botulinum]KOC57413.1 hypothetical protein ADU90_06270 [Clostridium botulinum]MCD3232652.1 hypothetical protein [Clostridium botulinum D/C]MCD3238419.1 hypothetical protein [Clostridium botulinum D/C]
MNNTYKILKNEILKNTKYIEIKHMSSYERFNVVEGTYKSKEFKVSYSKEYGQYTYDIKFGTDNEIAELMYVLLVMGILDSEAVDEWAEMTILKNELNLRKSKNFKTAVSRILS